MRIARRKERKRKWEKLKTRGKKTKRHSNFRKKKKKPTTAVRKHGGAKKTVRESSEQQKVTLSEKANRTKKKPT